MTKQGKPQSSKKPKETPPFKNVSTLAKKSIKKSKKILGRKLLDYWTKTETKKNKEKKGTKYKESSSQAEIPIKYIDENGIICTADNRYVTFVEIAPSSFFKKPENVREYTRNRFSMIFKNCPAKMGILILSDTTNPTQLIENIKRKCKDNESEEIKTAENDYIEHIKRLANSQAESKRYFIIYEYTGTEEGKSNKHSDIVRAMTNYRDNLINTMGATISPVIIPDSWRNFVYETLYYFFNRQTSRYVPFSERRERIISDYKKYNEVAGKKKKEPTFADFIAPKGIKFIDRYHLIMDGLFYRYMGIYGDSIDTYVEYQLLEMFSTAGPNVDVYIPIRKGSKAFNVASLKFKNRQTKSSISSAIRRNKDDKAENATNEYKYNEYIRKALESGDQDLFDVGIIMIFRNSQLKNIDSLVSQLQAHLATHSVAYDDGYLSIEEYFKMSMPFLYFTEPFNRIRRNFLTESMPALYDFVVEEMLDPKGFAFALNTENDSMVAVNNFNTSRYKNANMCIFGTSGSGKTFTEQLIARWMRLSGIRTFFIIPKKGFFDYYAQCKALNGSFIRLIPGSKDCINPLGIIPEGKIDEQLLGEDIIIDRGSLVSKKIVNVIIWLQLVMGKEELTTTQLNALNSELTALYEDFGIKVNDNSSIYEDVKFGKLKIMPQIEHLQKRIAKNEVIKDIAIALEPFVNGNCQNLNGQTNVDLANQYTVFDVDEELTGEKMLASFLYIAFDYVYDKMKEDPMSMDVLFLDEVWKMMKTEDCAKQVQNVSKLVRGYCGAVITATQEISDLMKSEGGFGKSVINNSEIKILLNMKETDADEIAPLMHLSDEIKEKICHFSRGHGVLIANGDATEISIIPSELALKTIAPKSANNNNNNE